MLIEKGADPNVKYKYISSKYYIKGGMFASFLEGNPICSYSYRTALDLAKQKKNTSIIELLETAIEEKANKQKVEDEMFQKAKILNTRGGYIEFLKKFPNSKYTVEISKRVSEIDAKQLLKNQK